MPPLSSRHQPCVTQIPAPTQSQILVSLYTVQLILTQTAPIRGSRSDWLTFSFLFFAVFYEDNLKEIAIDMTRIQALRIDGIKCQVT